MQEWDTIVLGCGTMGAAAIYELARAGQRVLGLDRFGPPHGFGSHHGHVRMFRMSYYEDPAYVPWLRRSLGAWRRMGEEFGAPLIETCGALYMGRPESELITGCLRAIEAHGLEHERLEHAALRARFPVFDVPRGYVGLLEKDAGLIHCELAVEAMLALGARAGAELRSHDAVLGWVSDGQRVVVKTESGESTAGSLVVCAGAWAGQLLKGVGVRLEVTRQVQGWVSAPAALSTLPCWAIDDGNGALFYGFPATRSQDGWEVKLARHARGTPVASADEVEHGALAGDAEDFMLWVRRFVPSLAGGAVRTGVCLYTNSPDKHYVVDRHPTYRNLAFAAGFSGHGFKAAPAVGEILSALVRGEAHPEPFFSLKRTC